MYEVKQKIAFNSPDLQVYMNCDQLCIQAT